MKPTAYSQPWPIDSALFEEGKREGRACAKAHALTGILLHNVVDLAFERADASPHAPWGGSHGRATYREDWAAGFREGYAEGAARASTVTRCPICREPAHAGETDESGAHPACVAAKPLPRFTLDSTVREVMGVLEGVVNVALSRLALTPAYADGAILKGYEASCSVAWEGDDDRGTRRLSALAPSALEALVALANEVVREG